MNLNENERALFLATTEGNREAVQSLLDNSVHVSIKDHRGMTPLHCAARYGHQSIVEFLIEKREASLDVEDKENMTPLQHAVKLGNQLIVEQLIEKGAEVNTEDD